MKKNAMLKIAAVVLVAVLLTTCAISSTFAKYVTKAELYKDEARVAKWGITVKSLSTEDDLFVNDYTDAAATEAIVAPGTAKSIKVTNMVSGTPEVDGVINYYVKITKVGFDSYDPLNLAVTGVTNLQANGTWELVTSQEFTANNPISDTADFTISWNWAFEDDVPEVVGEQLNTNSNDYKDTQLGGTNVDARVSVAVYVEVIQTNGSDNFAS